MRILCRSSPLNRASLFETLHGSPLVRLMRYQRMPRRSMSARMGLNLYNDSYLGRDNCDVSCCGRRYDTIVNVEYASFTCHLRVT